MMEKYISAEKLLKIIPYEETVSRFAVTHAPAEEVAPVIHAKWVKGRYCSNCECDDYDYCCRQPKYCPECGAKMEEE